MDTFLHDVARSLINHFGVQLADIEVIFPSRRAQRYFLRSIDSLGGKSPRCSSMNEWILMQDNTLSVAPKFTLVSKLYEIYKNHFPSENFDQFYSFGSLLVADFDMLDRYLVDARSLYSIVSDTRDIELSNDDPIKQAAARFWAIVNNVSAQQHKQQEFIRVWRSLYAIYAEFRELLKSENLAYAGMTYREVAENFDAQEYGRKVVFVGLNALSASEKLTLLELSKYDYADFIWDFDPQWLGDTTTESAYFISRNLEDFPQAHYYISSICQRTSIDIDLIEAPSKAAQCKLISPIINQLALENRANERTAIILTDENLLLPLLGSLPQCVGQLNISMGLPLRATLAYRFFELLISLQKRSRSGSGVCKFYYQDVLNIVNHPYIVDSGVISGNIRRDRVYFTSSELEEFLPNYAFLWRSIAPVSLLLHNYIADCLTSIQLKVEDTKELLFISKLQEVLCAANEQFAHCAQSLSMPLYLTLLNDQIALQSVEFEGVSGEGLQIMGILESRTLDFDRVIILSLDDDNFPSSSPDSSYISQLLLQGYGMPTTKDKSAIWSYYFYRLLTRCQKATLLYCNVADDKSTGEQSRYLWQMQFNSQYNICRKTISTKSTAIDLNNCIIVDKTPQIVETIRNLKYSPSLIETYTRCPIQFYFRYVEKIDRQQFDDHISGASIGNILHKSLYGLYLPFVNKPNVVGSIAQLSDSDISKVIDTVMHLELTDQLELYAAQASIAKKTIHSMVRAVVDFDANDQELNMIEMLEAPVNEQFNLINIFGVIDRIDRLVDGSLRIVDYKSGSIALDVNSIASAFLPTLSAKQLRPQVAQMLIYSLIAHRKWNSDITPVLYGARFMGGPDSDYWPYLNIEDQPITRLNHSHYQQIESSLKVLIDQLLSIDNPFIQSDDRKVCQYCDYLSICRR